MARTIAQTLDLKLPSHPIHAGPHARRHHGHRLIEEDPQHGAGGGSNSCKGRCSRISPGLTRSNRAPPKTQSPCCKPCRSWRFPSAGRRTNCRRLLRGRHAESDRAGRDLSAARGAARPLHVQHPSELPDARGEAAIVTSTTTNRQAVIKPVLTAAEILQLQELVRGVRSPIRSCNMRSTWSGRRAGYQPRPSKDGVHKYIRYGGSPPRNAIPDSRRQGPRGLERAIPTSISPTCGP